MKRLVRHLRNQLTRCFQQTSMKIFHASQVKKTNIEGLTIIDIIRSSAHFRGIQGRVKNAEGFLPLRLFINIGS